MGNGRDLWGVGGYLLGSGRVSVREWEGICGEWEGIC